MIQYWDMANHGAPKRIAVPPNGPYNSPVSVADLLEVIKEEFTVASWSDIEVSLGSAMGADCLILKERG